MSSTNPFSFLGGMFLEIGAAIAVVAFLWPPQQGDARTAMYAPSSFPGAPQYSPAQFATAPQTGYAEQAVPNSWPAREQDLFTQPAPAPLRETPRFAGQNWQEYKPLLPPAPESFEQFSQRQPAVAVARPYVRPLTGEPRYSQPAYRTAETPRDDFYSRY
jgi:hypothetical protein